MWNRLKRRLSRESPLQAVTRALDQGRADVETVLGLPHRLSVPLLQRHFGDAARASDARFQATGCDGHWTLPAPLPEFEVRLFGDADGRLTHGLIRGSGRYAGLLVSSDWSPDLPAPVWQVRLEESAGESAQALHEHLLGKD